MSQKVTMESNGSFSCRQECCQQFQNFTVAGVVNPDWNFFTGLILAVVSCLLIGSSYLVRKKSLIKLSHSGKVRASEGGMGYWTDWLWWLGIALMISGELINFVAYAFVPASLVAPLGSLSVIFSSILASLFLGEKINLIGKLSCALSLLGNTVTVIHVPSEPQVMDIDQLGSLIAEPEFVIYLLLVIILACFLIFFLSPKFGSKNVFVYLLISSLIGSLGIMAVKGVGLAAIQTIHGENAFNNGFTYIFIANLVVCISIQMLYLNKSLDLFNVSVVTPIFYVLNTAFVMIATGILFKEFSQMSWYDILGLSMGLSVTAISISMLHLFKDYAISVHDVTYVFSQHEGSLITSVRKAQDAPDFALEATPLLMNGMSLQNSLQTSETLKNGSSTTLNTNYGGLDQIELLVEPEPGPHDSASEEDDHDSEENVDMQALVPDSKRAEIYSRSEIGISSDKEGINERKWNSYASFQ